MQNDMRIHEIFESIQGEGPLVGEPTVFVRVFGCDRTCTWCDTGYTALGMKPEGQRKMTLNAVIEEILALWRKRPEPLRNVCFTGGEPILYADRYPQILNDRRMSDRNHVTLETNGENLFNNGACFERFTHIVISPKLSSSGRKCHNLFETAFKLRHDDRIYYKFVIGSEADFAEFVEIQKTLPQGLEPNPLYIQPATGVLSFGKLWKWVCECSDLSESVRVLPQVHKFVCLP